MHMWAENRAGVMVQLSVLFLEAVIEVKVYPLIKVVAESKGY